MSNSFVNAKVDLTTTDNTTLYTTPTANVALVKSILVSNDSGSGCNLDVTLTDSSGNVFSLFKTKSVAWGLPKTAESCHVVLSKVLVVQTGL